MIAAPSPRFGVARPQVAGFGRVPRGAASGVTLMELLLVLVLLVIAGSLAIPAITGAFAGVRLRRAGDAVMARWAEARAQAIETGVPYQFRFSPDSGTYRIEPSSTASAQAASTTVEAGVTSTSPPDAATSKPTSDPAPSAGAETAATYKSLTDSPTLESQLPGSITFQGGQLARDDAGRDGRRVDTLQQSASSWSTPILFFPDGSTSQATVVLQNDVPLFLRVTLRGLTGVARSSGVMTRDELDKSSQTR